MRFVRLLLIALAATCIQGCMTPFFDDQREYLVDYEQPLSTDEQRAVFESFKMHLKKQGRVAFFEHESDKTSSVTFRTHRVGYGPESDLFADILYLKYTENRTFVLKVSRHTFIKNDFTSDGLSTFIANTEASIQAASGKKVRLTRVQASKPAD
jgi:hypothetical protein